MAIDKPVQIARLRSLMQQADAEWEELARSIQVDQQLLVILRRYLDHCRIVLAMHGHTSGTLLNEPP